MTWTTDKPTEVGWYWYRVGDSKELMMQVWRGKSGAMLACEAENTSGIEMVRLHGKWQGPLNPDE